MKKELAYICALTVAFSTMLAGCGEMRGTPGETTAPTNTPAATIIPETAMPKPEDGIVNDKDGIITENDNGEIRTGENSMDNTKSGAGKSASPSGATGSAVR